MTGTLSLAALEENTEPAVDHALGAGLDSVLLEVIGWDWERRTVVFAAEHPLLGWPVCGVRGCGKIAYGRPGLCAACTARWRESGTADLEEFLATATRQRRRAGHDLCAVPGCEAVGFNKRNLCGGHQSQLVDLRLDLEVFLTDPRVRPMPRHEPCRVVACPRDSTGPGGLCRRHGALRRGLRREPGFDEAHWLRTAAPIAEDNEVVLLGLPDQVVLELLHGLQQRIRDERKTTTAALRPLVNRLRESEAASVRDLAPDGLSRSARVMWGSAVEVLHRRENNPFTAWASDRWSLESHGHTGTLWFGEITQGWLREATKHWVFQDLPRRRGRGVANTVGSYIVTVARFSASLTRHRTDHGHDPRALSHTDIVDLLNWQAYLEATGTITARTRRRDCRILALVLRRMRAMGLARAGGPLEGLPDDVAVTSVDVPPVADDEDDEAGRDLPAQVVTALIEHLPTLGAASSVEMRVAVELLIDTGRRPAEIAALALDCLGRDSTNRPELIWDNAKAHRYGRRLPITEATARIITDQQDRVRARFPSTPPDDLVLLPARYRNPSGTRALDANTLANCHREWVDTVPELSAPVTVVDDAGRTITRTLPFDKKNIVPYSWRHTYAQRHADAGVPVDVLCELMDHKSMSTTQGYYRVSEARRRDAVDRVTTMAFDRHGNRVWRRAQALLDSERARRGLGEVAVPYGLCTEPSNVAAGGGDCPIRFRCVGCDHFRTDVSYLPDLEAYLSDLLRNRERLRAMTTADTWALAEAAPSDHEIDRVRTLIRRVKADVDDLDDARAEIQAAVTAVRRARSGAVGLGMPRVRPEPMRPEPLDDRQEPTL